MSSLNIVRMLSLVAFFCIVARPVFCKETANSVVTNECLEKLFLAACNADAGIGSLFNLDDEKTDTHVSVSVSECRSLGRRLDLGCWGEGAFRLRTLPSNISCLFLNACPSVLEDIGICPSIKEFSVDGVRTCRDAVGLCMRFPEAENVSLGMFVSEDVGPVVSCLTKMQKLKNLELHIHGLERPLEKGLVERLVNDAQRLEKGELIVGCDLKPFKDVSDPLKSHTFEISDSLENNSTGIVEVPDWGEYTDVTLHLYSPSVRSVEFRLPSVKGGMGASKLRFLTLNLHNVLPSGETSLIDSGNLLYCIHIDKTENVE